MIVEFKTWTYHERFGVGAHGRAAGRGRAERGVNRTVAQETRVLCTHQSIEERAPDRISRPVEPKTWTYHERVRSGRTARRRGSGRTACQQNCSPRRQASFAPSKASKTRRLHDSPEARTSEILCKPMEDQNPRLTTGSSAGREALFVPGC